MSVMEPHLAFPVINRVLPRSLYFESLLGESCRLKFENIYFRPRQPSCSFAQGKYILCQLWGQEVKP